MKDKYWIKRCFTRGRIKPQTQLNWFKMEKSVRKGVDSAEVKKMALSSVYLSLKYLLPHFTDNHIAVWSYQNPLLRCMNQHFGMYNSHCGGWALQWKSCRDLESRCESRQGQSKWGSRANCPILYMNLQKLSISLLLGDVTCGHAEHNYHQAESIALFLPLAGGEHWHVSPFQAWQREHIQTVPVETPKTFPVERAP